MKKSKLLIGLLSVSCLVGLTGCSFNIAKNKNGEDIVSSLKGKEISADNIYDKVINSNKTVAFQAIVQKLIDEKFPVTKEMETDAQSVIKQVEDYYKQQYSTNAEEQLKTAIKQYGFNSLDDYKKQLVKQIQASNFLLNYVKNNFDKVFEDYYKQASPRYLSIIHVKNTDINNPTTEEVNKLNEVKALLKTSKSFGEIAKSYSDDSDSAKNNGSLNVVDSSSNLATSFGKEVETAALSLEEGKISDPIKGNTGYYILKNDSNNKDKIKSYVKNHLDVDSPLLTYDTYMQYLAFQDYKITYSDKKLEKLIQEVIDGALKERATSRKEA